MDLDGQVWFITGASSGLGRALTESVIESGGRVAAVARRRDVLRELETDQPERILTATADVADSDAMRRAVEATTHRFGRLDVLVNNAGFGVFGALEELAEDALRREFDTNVFGALNAIRAVLPQFRAQRSGHIVQISSLEGIAPVFAAECAYAGSKFAMEGVCEALAREVAHLGIRVTIVEPGPIRTDFAQGATVQAPQNSDYDASVGAALEAFADLAGKQPNDARSVAHAVLAATSAPEPPLRLPLGAEAVAAIREKIGRQSAELDRWAELSLSTGSAG
jgi:NAD(P)-dependent dehydrogenase (short-subunit alcohol dehydrogenase family)